MKALLTEAAIPNINSSIGARNSNNQVVFEESDVSFKSGEECITELQKIIDELGYHSEDFIFACYPLNSQTMKIWKNNIYRKVV